MKCSDKGLKFLTELEGVVLVPYRDSVGVWTIGVGHTKAAGHPDPKGHGIITYNDALDMLARDIRKFEADVNKALTTPVKQHEFDALVSFHFNTGAIGRATLTKLLNRGDRAGAAKAFMNWTRAGKNQRALLYRRTAETELFTSGNYGEPFMVSVWTKWPGKPKQMLI